MYNETIKDVFGMPHYGELEVCIVLKYYNIMSGTYPILHKKKNNMGKPA